MPPEPIIVSLSRIFVHGEVARGDVLVLLNQKLNLISNGNLVACGTALPEKISETINIPHECMTTFQWALANVDKAFWDYGVPLLCVGALGVGILFLRRFMDYVDNVGTITVETESWRRAQRAIALEEDLKEASKRAIEYPRVQKPSRGGTAVEPKNSMSDEEWGKVMDQYYREKDADDYAHRASAVVASHRVPVDLRATETTPNVTVLEGTSYLPINPANLLTEEVQDQLRWSTSSGEVDIEIDNTTEPKSLVIKLYRLLKRS